MKLGKKILTAAVLSAVTAFMVTGCGFQSSGVNIFNDNIRWTS